MEKTSHGGNLKASFLGVSGGKCVETGMGSPQPLHPLEEKEAGPWVVGVASSLFAASEQRRHFATFAFPYSV